MNFTISRYGIEKDMVGRKSAIEMKLKTNHRVVVGIPTHVFRLPCRLYNKILFYRTARKKMMENCQPHWHI